jgi:hypothetical protein
VAEEAKGNVSGARVCAAKPAAGGGAHWTSS